MSQRAVLQYLSLTEWKLAHRLPIHAGEMMLSRMAHLGWIELRGKNHLTEIRLTEVGRKAMRWPT
jgi:Mn-dependent DtxR family transcriptional regulator